MTIIARGGADSAHSHLCQVASMMRPPKFNGRDLYDFKTLLCRFPEFAQHFGYEWDVGHLVLDTPDDLIHLPQLLCKPPVHDKAAQRADMSGFNWR